jgi:hypothetical protein
MPCVLIRFIHRPVCGIGHCIGIMLERPPEVGHHAIEIVDRLNPWIGWPP